MNPFEVFGFGIGAKIDSTTMNHIVIYSGLFLAAIPFLAWRMGEREVQLGFRMFAFSPRVYVSISNASIIAWFWLTLAAAFVVEFEQGLDYSINKGSYFDLFDFGIPLIINILLRKFVFKLKD